MVEIAAGHNSFRKKKILANAAGDPLLQNPEKTNGKMQEEKKHSRFERPVFCKATTHANAYAWSAACTRRVCGAISCPKSSNIVGRWKSCKTTLMSGSSLVVWLCACTREVFGRCGVFSFFCVFSFFFPFFFFLLFFFTLFPFSLFSSFFTCFSFFLASWGTGTQKVVRKRVRGRANCS